MVNEDFISDGVLEEHQEKESVLPIPVWAFSMILCFVLFLVLIVVLWSQQMSLFHLLFIYAEGITKAERASAYICVTLACSFPYLYNFIRQSLHWGSFHRKQTKFDGSSVLSFISALLEVIGVVGFYLYSLHQLCGFLNLLLANIVLIGPMIGMMFDLGLVKVIKQYRRKSGKGESQPLNGMKKVDSALGIIFSLMASLFTLGGVCIVVVFVVGYFILKESRRWYFILIGAFFGSLISISWGLRHFLVDRDSIYERSPGMIMNIFKLVLVFVISGGVIFSGLLDFDWIDVWGAVSTLKYFANYIYLLVHGICLLSLALIAQNMVSIDIFSKISFIASLSFGLAVNCLWSYFCEDWIPFLRIRSYDRENKFDFLFIVAFVLIIIGRSIIVGFLVSQFPYNPLAGESNVWNWFSFTGVFQDISLITNLRTKITGGQEAKQPDLVYVCCTFWQENELEMETLIKSLIRLSKYQGNKKKYIAHLIVDNAITKDKETCRKVDVFNDYVLVLLGLLGLLNDEDKTSMPFSITSLNCCKRAELVCKKVGYGYVIRCHFKEGMECNIHLKDTRVIQQGKRHSQLLYLNLFASNWKKDLERFKVESDDKFGDHVYVLMLDGDVEFKPRGVAYLEHFLSAPSMQREKKPRHSLAMTNLTSINSNGNGNSMMRYRTAAVCGRIRPMATSKFHPIFLFQRYEYAVGHWLQKTAEQVLGTVLCAPGAWSMYRLSALLEPEIKDTYSKKVGRPRDFLQQNMGEDRWLCALLVANRYKIKYCSISVANTFCPSTFFEFFRQRLRWEPSTNANILDVCEYGFFKHKQKRIVSLPYVCYTFILFALSFLAPGMISYLIASALRSLAINEPWNMIIANICPILLCLICVFFSDGVQLKAAVTFSIVYVCVMFMAVAVLGFEVFKFFLNLIPVPLKEVGVGVVGSTFGIGGGNGLLNETISTTMPDVIYSSTFIGIQVFSVIFHGDIVDFILGFGVYWALIPMAYLFLKIFVFFNMDSQSWGTRSNQSGSKNCSEKTSIQEKALNYEDITVSTDSKQQETKKRYEHEMVEADVLRYRDLDSLDLRLVEKELEQNGALCKASEVDKEKRTLLFTQVMNQIEAGCTVFAKKITKIWIARKEEGKTGEEQNAKIEEERKKDEADMLKKEEKGEGSMDIIAEMFPTVEKETQTEDKMKAQEKKLGKEEKGEEEKKKKTDPLIEDRIARNDKSLREGLRLLRTEAVIVLILVNVSFFMVTWVSDYTFSAWLIKKSFWKKSFSLFSTNPVGFVLLAIFMGLLLLQFGCSFIHRLAMLRFFIWSDGEFLKNDKRKKSELSKS